MDLQDLPVGMLSFLLQKSEISHLGPRLGQLALRGRPGIQTPNFIANTSRGVIPHLTPDNLQKHTAVAALYFGLEDFIEKTTPNAPVLQTPLDSSTFSRLRHFSGTPDRCLTILGPRRVPIVPCPKQNANDAIAISTAVGFSDLQIDDYLEATERLQPDLCVSIADIPSTGLVSKKRIEKSADRTHAWLRDTLAAVEGSATKPSLFASIPPLEPEQQSLYLADLGTEYKNELSGLCMYSPDSVNCIPDQLHGLPRICLEDAKSPQETLRTVALGVDLVTAPFVTTASEAGLCLTFQFPGRSTNANSEIPLGYDLWSTEHAADVSSLSPDCSCYTCTRHQKAYLHHLLQAKEMLAWNLLQIHNLHIIHQFFKSIQVSLIEDRFDEGCQTFEQIYESELPVQTGLGPRLRGYQLKSVGGGESKKNTKAYGRLDEHARKIEEAESGIATTTIDETADVLQQQGFASRIE